MSRLPLLLLTLVSLTLAACQPGAQAASAPAAAPTPAATTPPAAAAATPASAATSAAMQSASTPAAKPPQNSVTPTATPQPTQVTATLAPVWTGLSQPLYLTHAGDGSNDVFIVEKGGTIKVVRGGQGQPEVFMRLNDRVRSTGSEQGLLGLAFHPDYRQNRQFYVHYTGSGGQTVLSRFTANEDRRTGNAGSERVLLQVEQPFANHNGGQLSFGPDGYLYLGLGDGGSAADPQRHGQNLNTLLGAILRLDVNSGDPYGIPGDNPFVGRQGARPEIWAYGLRNPWRFSFDRELGDLFIGDVGQNTWEEINFLPAGSPAGANFGWARMEGSVCFPIGSQCDRSGLVLPVAEYQTRVDGCSVTGGYVYRGRQFANTTMYGAYFFSDYCTNRLWSLRRNPAGEWETGVEQQTAAANAGISSFGEDEAGEIYATGLNNGTVYRLKPR